MSGLTSQPNFNVLVESLRNTPYETKTDVNSLNEFSNYWETVREYYYPFESGLMAGTAEVYKHEIPGGQYSNLKPQAISLGLAERMDEIKKAYEDVNEMFGDIVKVTPSSKVVGDMAMFMVNNKFSKKTSSKRKSVVSGVCEEYVQRRSWTTVWRLAERITKIILRDQKPYTDLPNAHLKPIDFEIEFEEFQKNSTTIRAFSISFHGNFIRKFLKSTIISTSSLAM